MLIPSTLWRAASMLDASVVCDDVPVVAFEVSVPIWVTSAP